MHIYSWKDARAEREEVRAASLSSSSSSGSKADPKGKAREQEDISKLRRLPRVERGVKEGSGDWQKKVEPGQSPPRCFGACEEGREDQREGRERSKLGLFAVNRVRNQVFAVFDIEGGAHALL